MAGVGGELLLNLVSFSRTGTPLEHDDGHELLLQLVHPFLMAFLQTFVLLHDVQLHELQLLQLPLHLFDLLQLNLVYWYNEERPFTHLDGERFLFKEEIHEGPLRGNSPFGIEGCHGLGVRLDGKAGTTPASSSGEAT